MWVKKMTEKALKAYDKTIEDVEALIEISAKVEDGKYKIDIDANTQTAIDNINAFNIRHGNYSNSCDYTSNKN